MKKCPYCAEEIQNEAIVCKHCGRDLVSKPKNNPPGTVIAGLGLGLLIVSLGLAWLMSDYPQFANCINTGVGIGGVMLLVGLLQRLFARENK